MFTLLSSDQSFQHKTLSIIICLSLCKLHFSEMFPKDRNFLAKCKHCPAFISGWFKSHLNPISSVFRNCLFDFLLLVMCNVIHYFGKVIVIWYINYFLNESYSNGNCNGKNFNIIPIQSFHFKVIDYIFVESSSVADEHHYTTLNFNTCINNHKLLARDQFCSRDFKYI